MSDHKDLLEFRRLELLYTQARVSIPAVVVSAYLIVWVTNVYTDITTFMFVWAGLYTLLNAVRFAQTQNHIKNVGNHDSPKKEYRKFFIGATLSALMLSALSVHMIAMDNLNLKVLTILYFCGLCSASMTIYSVYREVALTFAAITILPPSVALLLETETTPVAMGLFMLIYFIFTVFSLFGLNQMVMRGLRSQLENADLLRQLGEEKRTVDEVNSQLQADILQRKQIEKELIDAKSRAEGRAEELSEISMRDSLTGIANRRGFDYFIEREWNLALTKNSSIALIVCDVDYFKKYNDLYGHTKGDYALRKIANTLEAKVRTESDLVARYGGEEFVVVLPHSDLETAVRIAEKIQLAIDAMGIPHPASTVKEHLTCSFGIASVVPNPELAPQYLFHRADRALYAAKGAGRNRIVSDDCEELDSLPYRASPI